MTVPSHPREPRRNRRLQDYSDRFGGESEPRLSRTDEQVFADLELARRERDRVDDERHRLARDAELKRRIAVAIAACDDCRELLVDEEQKGIDHHLRRLRSLLAGIRRD
jgi:hypothetical protein